MRAQTFLVVLVLGLFTVPACSPKQDGSSDGDRESGQAKATVYTVNYPLAYFAERIGGTRVIVKFPAPAGEDPAFWMPDQSTITDYKHADLILLNGATYAKWIDKVSLPDSKLVNTSASLGEQYIKMEKSLTHSHGPGGEHAHGDLAFTTWLDPSMGARQAKAIADAFARKWPEHAGAFEAGYKTLEKDLLELDGQLKDLVARSPDRPLLFSHPVYQYLIRRYGIKGKSVHWEPDAAPAPGMWSELDALVKQHPAEWMVWEGEPLAATVEALRKRGIRSLVFDPCGNAPDEGDYLAVMRRNIRSLEPAFKTD